MQVKYVVAVLIIGSVGCVSRQRFDTLREQSKRMEANLDRCRGERAEAQKLAETKLRETEKQRAALAGALAACRQTYGSQVAELAELGRRLEQLKRDSAAYSQAMARCRSRALGRKTVAEKLQKDLETLRGELATRVASLERARKEAERQRSLHTDLTTKLRAQITAGKLTVVLTGGRLVIQLRTAVLFDSGRADFKVDGRTVLDELARAIKGTTDRHFQVAGHTDDQPIRYSRFASNWSLSSARAVQVVEYLDRRGVPGKQVSAGGFGPHLPVGPNTTPAGRKANRRIEITLLPLLPSHVLKTR